MRSHNFILSILQMGLEPTTFCSEDRCSTIEPLKLMSPRQVAADTFFQLFYSFSPSSTSYHLDNNDYNSKNERRTEQGSYGTAVVARHGASQSPKCTGILCQSSNIGVLLTFWHKVPVHWHAGFWLVTRRLLQWQRYINIVVMVEMFTSCGSWRESPDALDQYHWAWVPSNWPYRWWLQLCSASLWRHACLPAGSHYFNDPPTQHLVTQAQNLNVGAVVLEKGIKWEI